MHRQNSKSDITKRSNSKFKDTSKISQTPIINSSKIIHKPINYSKNNEMFNKMNDNYKDIKEVNLNLYEKETVVKKNFKNPIELRPSTPNNKRTPSVNQEKPKKVNKSYINPKNYLSIDKAAIIIQRTYRRYIKKLRSDPKYEMTNMLKRKKLNILKTYNINLKDSNVVDDFFPDNIEYKLFEQNENKTANFGNEIKKIDEISIEDRDKYNDKKKIEESFDFNFILPKEKLNNNLDETNEIVNVYEKIYKEIKKNNEDNKILTFEEFKANEILKEVKYAKNKEYSIDNKENINLTQNDKNLTKNEDKIEIIKNDNNISSISNINHDNIINDENKKLIDNITKLIDEDFKHDTSIKEYKNNSIIIGKDETQDKINRIYSILEDNSHKEIDNKYHNIYKNLDNNKKIESSIVQNTAEILNMALELKEYKKTVDAMKEIIEELKKDNKIKDDFYQKDINDKLNVQKYEFENILQRQSGLVESLLSEKKKLTTMVDELNEKLSIIDKSNHKKIQTMLENFDLETKKNKDAWFQAEKIRRKKWEDSKMKEIKEMTVKGLEPEIERILSNHKQEVSKMEDRFNEDLRKQRERLNTDFEKRLSDIKERFVKEKEEALEHERSLAGQRLRNQNERLEEEYGEERRRWNNTLVAEIQRLETLREKDKKLYEDQLTAIEDRNRKLTEEKESYFKLKISEMEKRYEDKIKVENEEYRLKNDKEKEKYIEEKTKEMDLKSKEIKNELLKDRDKQIQIILEKLGEETVLERKKIQLECENRADSINKNLRYENEQMKLKIQELTEKITAESKTRLTLDENLDSLSKKLFEKERDINKKEKTLNELNANLSDINNRYSNISREFNKEKLDLENEYRIKLQKSENDIKLLSEKMENVKHYYENKINDVQNSHKNEIIEIEDRIKKSFSRKEEVIKKLQDDIQLKEITIQKYEDLLAKQRKELLKNN